MDYQNYWKRTANMYNVLIKWIKMLDYLYVLKHQKTTNLLYLIIIHSNFYNYFFPGKYFKSICLRVTIKGDGIWNNNLTDITTLYYRLLSRNFSAAVSCWFFLFLSVFIVWPLFLDMIFCIFLYNLVPLVAPLGNVCHIVFKFFNNILLSWIINGRTCQGIDAMIMIPHVKDAVFSTCSNCLQ